ncbi:MAG: metal-sensitive transcriptional regulator [Chloroflexi bacterium]|nr:metal-sensitive transcriptional regulator [Chloroflexota bacterium]
MATRDDSERAIQARLARIEGQVRGIRKMIEDGRPCDEIVTQVLAARTALERTAAEIVDVYLDECLLMQPDEARNRIGRTVKLLTRAS